MAAVVAFVRDQPSCFLSSRGSGKLCVCLQGSAVTSGLRKVTDDMKAKNRTDRTGVVSGGPAAAAARKAAQPAAVGPPK